MSPTTALPMKLLPSSVSRWPCASSTSAAPPLEPATLPAPGALPPNVFPEIVTGLVVLLGEMKATSSAPPKPSLSFVAEFATNVLPVSSSGAALSKNTAPPE